jgi:serine/threonine protein kinase
MPSTAGNTLAGGTKLQGGHFTVGKVLGQGGFGITYLGSDTRLKRPRAIKEYFPHGYAARQSNTVVPTGMMTVADYQSAKVKFLEEARVLAQFQHPGIVHVYTSFEEYNTAYVVMEYLKGKTLSEVLGERGPLPEGQAIDCIATMGEALAVVHQANLLHRDIKPENVIVTDEGRVVLVDFGTAREFAAGKTKQMTAMLTPGYAPLEQYGQQARFGPFTDIYALGATLYHLLTGHVPVHASDRATGVRLPSPQELNTTVSPAVSDAVMWAMEIKVEHRPQVVPEFLGALRGLVTPKRPAVPSTVPHNAFKFKNGAAFSVADLIDLCDQYGDEAEDYLFHGYFERWLVGSLGEGALAQKAHTITQRYQQEKWKGLELFVREGCKQVGIAPFPQLAAQPDRLDLGRLPLGAQTSRSLRLHNTGRGHAWGAITISPGLPGLSVPPKFESPNASVDLRLDTLNLTPGTYTGILAIQADGVPTPCAVPVQYTVQPLALHLQPSALELGAVSHGQQVTKAVQIVCTPSGGRLTGTYHFDPPCEGLHATGSINGSSTTLGVTLETQSLAAGTRYTTHLVLRTNAGTFTVLVRFQVTTNWRPVAGWTATLGLSTGISMGLVRFLLAEAAFPLKAWFLTFVEQRDILWACGMFATLLIGGTAALVKGVKGAKKA